MDELLSNCSNIPFCASPWAEGVLGANGEYRVCAKLPPLFSLDWRELGLENTFNSTEMQNIREMMIKGEIPHANCQTCIDTNTVRPLNAILKRAVFIAINELKKIDESIDYSELNSIFEHLKLKNWDEDAKEQIEKTRSKCSALSIDHPELTGYLDKLLKVLLICESFLKRDLVVPVIASMRQVSLKSKCNARCIHCPGLFAGWINSDLELNEKYYDEAFSHIDDITDFFMNGAEYLFVKNWKNISERLRDAHVKTAISTNGILLTKSNIKHLIDYECMDSLNISLDGGTKETIESIRVGLNFDILMRNLTFLFQYAYEKKYQFMLSFSFVMMKQNYSELPELIKMISELKYSVSPDNLYPTVCFGCSTLDHDNIPGYNEFVSEQSHDLIENSELQDIFVKCQEYCDMYNVKLGVLRDYGINSFINAGFPLPTRAPHHRN